MSLPGAIHTSVRRGAEEIKQMQSQVLWFIKSYIKEKGFAPSFRDIAKGTKLSLSSVQDEMFRLREEGAISYVPGLPRSITLKKKR